MEYEGRLGLLDAQKKKKLNKKSKKSEKGVGFLKSNRNLSNPNIYTKAPDADIPTPGPKLMVDDNFSKNIFD